MPAKRKPSRPKSAAERMRAHRARLRAQGLRPIQHWVPDLRDPKVRAEIRRQGELLSRHPENDEIDAWLEAVLDSRRSRTVPHKTRVFRSGNSQAVRIPADLAYEDDEVDLKIARLGDVITIFPANAGLGDAVAELKRMPKPARRERRRPIEVPLRNRD
jgi:virulence-associated protein VagC